MSSATFAVPVGRFVWKEYRALRGLWLGVLALGLSVDWAGGVLWMTGATDVFAFRLSVALAAATLYAAGAASVAFSLEHEEQTYGFLRGLPATWGPMFVGKLLFVVASAVGLALVLLSAWWRGGGGLAPEFLPAVPMDSYSLQPFWYFPKGWTCRLLVLTSLIAGTHRAGSRPVRRCCGA